MDKEKTEYICDKLKKITDQNNIYINEPMKKHTSFKVGGNADVFVKIRNVKELKEVLKIIKEERLPFFIMGNGSNLLVKDNGIRGIVLKIELDKIEIDKKEEYYYIKVGAGVKLMAFARRLLREEIEGFEFASGIPGTIGGAIRMNAGAYGGEMKDIVVETTFMDTEGNIHILKNSEHEFEYRNSIFSKKNWIILETTLKLKKGNKKQIKEKMEEYASSRSEKQPLKYPSAGSTFRRGEGYITAKLIDECGLKGYRIGDAQVSELHAGFVINKGNATAEDLLKLIEQVKEKVYEKFNKKIELEIQVIGE